VRAARILLILVALLAAVPWANAQARDGGSDQEIRREGTCGRGASSRLRVRARDGEIEVRLDVRSSARRARWRIALVHERRVVWRATRTSSSSGQLSARRTVPDFDGADQITISASGPRGVVCRSTVTVPG
jgi:hypothetical protein